MNTRQRQTPQLPDNNLSRFSPRATLGVVKPQKQWTVTAMLPLDPGSALPISGPKKARAFPFLAVIIVCLIDPFSGNTLLRTVVPSSPSSTSSQLFRYRAKKSSLNDLFWCGILTESQSLCGSNSQVSVYKGSQTLRRDPVDTFVRVSILVGVF